MVGFAVDSVFTLNYTFVSIRVRVAALVVTVVFDAATVMTAVVIDAVFVAVILLLLRLLLFCCSCGCDCCCSSGRFC